MKSPYFDRFETMSEEGRESHQAIGLLETMTRAYEKSISAWEIIDRAGIQPENMTSRISNNIELVRMAVAAAVLAKPDCHGIAIGP